MLACMQALMHLPLKTSLGLSQEGVLRRALSSAPSQCTAYADLVFIQNGMLQPWLDSNGLGGNTQVLVFFGVAKKGEKPTDGKTDVNPEGLTAGKQ